MNRLVSSWIACVVLAGTASGALAAPRMKPGLWEITSNMQSSRGDTGNSMAQMQRQMAAMPPEQRKMAEEMMARNGRGMSAGPTGGMTMKTCVTKEMAERNQMLGPQPGHCTSTATPASGSTMAITFTCTQPPSSGEGQITFASDQAYSMKMTMRRAAKGGEEQSAMEMSGKWIGSDCGTIQPVAMPAQ
jgi:hypothetical protein